MQEHLQYKPEKQKSGPSIDPSDGHAHHIEPLRKSIFPTSRHQDIEDLEHDAYLSSLTGDRRANQHIIEVGRYDGRSDSEIIADLNQYWRKHKHWIAPNPTHLSTFLHQCTPVADASSAESLDWKQAINCLDGCWEQMNWRELATTVADLTHLDEFNQDIQERVSELVQGRLQGISKKEFGDPNLLDLSQLLWSFAKQGTECDQLYESLLESISPMIPKESDPVMANTIMQSLLWIGHRSEEIVLELKAANFDQVIEFQSESAAPFVFFLALHGQLTFEELDLAARSMTYTIESYSSMQLAMISSACRVADYRNERFLNLIGNQLVNNTPFDTSFDDLTHAAQTFAALNFYHPGVEDALMESLPEDLSNRDTLARAVDAFTALNQLQVADAYFNERCIDAFCQHFDKLPEREVGKVIWAAAMTDNDRLFRKLWDTFIAQGAHINYQDVQATQIYQASLAKEVALPAFFIPAFSKLKESKPPQPEPSYFEQQVADCLDRLGVQYAKQGEEAGYFIDIVIEEKDKRIALECDGDIFHYRYGDPTQGLNGKSLLKQQVLERAGYEVLRLPYSQWLAIGDDRQQQEEVVTQLLNKLLAA